MFIYFKGYFKPNLGSSCDRAHKILQNADEAFRRLGHFNGDMGKSQCKSSCFSNAKRVPTDPW